MNNELSNNAVIVVLIISFSWAFGLSSLLWHKHKAHALWLFPLGWLIGFALTVIISVLFGNSVSNGVLAAAFIILMPAPIYFLFSKKLNINQVKNIKLKSTSQAQVQTYNTDKIDNQQDKDKVVQLVKQNQELRQENERLKKENESLQRQNKALESNLQSHAKIIEKQSQTILDLEKSGKKIPSTSEKRLLSRAANKSTQSVLQSSGLPQRGNTIKFGYTNANHESSSREVYVITIDDEYIKGHDFGKDETRTFRRDRVHNGIVTDCDTGEIYYI